MGGIVAGWTMTIFQDENITYLLLGQKLKYGQQPFLTSFILFYTRRTVIRNNTVVLNQGVDSCFYWVIFLPNNAHYLKTHIPINLFEIIFFT